MNLMNETCTVFLEQLASKAAVPGGGGASALVGAVGVALGNMVGNLTVGKKKYADVEADVIELDKKAEALRQRFVDLVAADAEAFEPLSRAYGLPKDTEEQRVHKAQVMEKALDAACAVPMDIMRTVCQAIELHKDYARMGSAIAISDVGVGVVCCKAALQGASLNVFINTKSMADRAKAQALEDEANQMLDKYCAMADEIYAVVCGRLK